MPDKIAFLMPEFPGHTHTWLWREICGLRELGLTVDLASTRPPKPCDRARHSFAAEIEGQVFYAWPPKPLDVVSFLLTIVFVHPHHTFKCLQYAWALDRDGGQKFKLNASLLLPAWRLARWCRQREISHIHVATPANSLIIAQMAALLVDLTTDVTINANLDWWGGAMKEKLSRCAVVFPVAEWIRRQIQEEYPETIYQKTFVARHGVDTSAWNPDNRKPSSSDRLMIVSVGRLHPGKGHDDLIRAIKLLYERGHQAELVIAGGGPDLERLLTLIDSLGVSDLVTLPGPMEESAVRALLEGADIFALASHAEALGVVLMEAMALRVPIVTTKTNGAREIIEDGKSGLLVEINKPIELADTLERLIFDPELCERLGAAGLKRVRESFDYRVGAKIVGDQIVNLLCNRP